MNIVIIVLLVFAIFFTGTLTLTWGDESTVINCNWLALAALVLYLIENFH